MSRRLLLHIALCPLFVLSLLTSVILLAPPRTAKAAGSVYGIQHFILVIADGMSWEVLNQLQPPNIMSMISTGAAASHGVCEVPSVTDTDYDTIFSGAHASTHGDVGNQYLRRVSPNTDTIQYEIKHAGLTYEEVTSSDTIVNRIQGGSLASLTVWWTEEPDGAGHGYGPQSDQYEDAIEAMGSSIGAIMQALQTTGMSATTVLGLGADHGMQNLLPATDTAPDTSRILDLRAILQNKGIQVSTWLGSGPRMAHVYLTDPSQASAAKQVLQATPGIDRAFTKAELDGTSLGGEVTAFLDSPNSGDVIAFAAADYALGRSIIQSASDGMGGNDGRYYWDCENSYRGGHGGLTSWEMYVPFVLWGGPIIGGTNLGTRFNVDWAPTMAVFLGVATPAESVGTAAVDALRQPGAVSTRAATNVATTSATLNGSLNVLGTAGSDNVSFQWGLTTSYGQETTPTPMTATGTFSANLTGLAGKTTYHFRAKAEGGGSPAYGSDMTFTTLPTAPSPIAPSVTTAVDTKVATASATLNGDLTSMGTAASDNVFFEWGLTTSYGNTTTTQVKAAVGVFSDNLTGLAAKTTYHYRAMAVGDGSAAGDDLTFTTSAVAPTVTTDNVSGIGTTFATLNGNLTAMGTAGVKNSVGTFSVDLTGLTPGITYYYRAKADGDGNPVYGTETSFTASVIPPAVTIGDATNVTSTSARLNANLVSLGTKTSVTVSFLWRLTGGTYTETPSQAMTAGGAVWADLNGLTQETTYYYKVKVVGAGDPAYSDEKSFTTADSAAPAISVVSTSDITVPSATVTWTTNEPATSQIEYGLTEEYGSLTTLDTNLVKSHSVDLTGLKAGKTYHYRVISKDASNNQAVSEDATFTTSAGTSSKMPFWPWLLIGLVGAAQVGGAVYFERAETAQDTLVRRLDEAVRRVNLLERENDETTVKMQSLEGEVNKLRNLISLAESVADEI